MRLVTSLKPPITISANDREFAAVTAFDPRLARFGSVFDGVGGLTFWAGVFHGSPGKGGSVIFSSIHSLSPLDALATSRPVGS